MRISIADAEGQLTELIRLARKGEEVVLMEEGQPVIRLEPVQTFIADPAERDAFIRKLQEDVRRKNLPPGPDAARSQDFLYDEFGLPK
ncbi:type II toxin-antitoxin system prevent-host-death family antitoxin [Neorhizobium sp. P12A]|nr:type II toxin-antitoxin system prevent-host-death family antitoxin [Neorhizobium sp. P12A]KAA0701301.1 type II toxin-antitoxin system prevent-host-death family antitoxin [Neorhizobium sp. P12A]